MFIREEYGEGVDSIGDLVERDMSLGKYIDLYDTPCDALNPTKKFWARPY